MNRYEELSLYAIAEGFALCASSTQEARLCEASETMLPFLWNFSEPEERVKLLITRDWHKFMPPLELRLESGALYLLKGIRRRKHMLRVSTGNLAFRAYELRYTIV